MADLMFVVKTFLFTLALVVLMQIKVGDRTIEERSHQWIQHSAIHKTLGKVATGAVTAMKDGADYMRNWVAGNNESSSAASQANRK